MGPMENIHVASMMTCLLICWHRVYPIYYVEISSYVHSVLFTVQIKFLRASYKNRKEFFQICVSYAYTSVDSLNAINCLADL